MLKLFAPLLSGMVGEEVNAAVTSVKRNVISYTLTIVFVIACVIFLLIAAYLALALSVGKIYSALIMAAGCMFVALISFIVNKLLVNAQRRHLQRQRAAAGSSTALTAVALAAAPTLIKRPALAIALPLIGIAGYILFSGSRQSSKRPKD